MSFQGIRKIRDARKESPILFESSELTSQNCSLKPFQFNFDLKGSNLSSDIRTTRDSEIKPDHSAKQARKNSLGLTSCSKEKDKKILIGNFLYFLFDVRHVNLDGLKSIKVNR
jgi:hypothetical protein